MGSLTVGSGELPRCASSAAAASCYLLPAAATPGAPARQAPPLGPGRSMVMRICKSMCRARVQGRRPKKQGGRQQHRHARIQVIIHSTNMTSDARRQQRPDLTLRHQLLSYGCRAPILWYALRAKGGNESNARERGRLGSQHRLILIGVCHGRCCVDAWPLGRPSAITRRQEEEGTNVPIASVMQCSGGFLPHRALSHLMCPDRPAGSHLYQAPLPHGPAI